MAARRLQASGMPCGHCAVEGEHVAPREALVAAATLGGRQPEVSS